MSDYYVTPWTVACQAPLSMGFLCPGQDMEHFLLQGIFLTQGSNPCLLHWQADSLPLSHQGSSTCTLPMRKPRSEEKNWPVIQPMGAKGLDMQSLELSLLFFILCQHCLNIYIYMCNLWWCSFQKKVLTLSWSSDEQALIGERRGNVDTTL